MSADYLKRPGTVAHGERPGTTSKPTRASLDALMEDRAGASPSPGEGRRKSLSIEEMLAGGGTDFPEVGKTSSTGERGSPLKTKKSQDFGGFPSSRKLHTSSGAFATQRSQGMSPELGSSMHSERLGLSTAFSQSTTNRRAKTAGSVTSPKSKPNRTSRTRGMNMNMLFDSPDVSYRKERATMSTAGASKRVGTALEGKGMSLDFLLPKTMIPEKHEVAERWPIVPNLLRARNLSSFKSLKDEGVYYDAENKQWCKTVFPSWQPGSRADAMMLRKWANEAIESFNMSTPKSNVLEDMKRAQKILSTAFHELTRQVLISCRERGELMAELWNSQTVLFARAMEISELELNRTHLKLEEAENKVEEAKQAALDEKINQVLKSRQIADENESMKKELKELRRKVDRRVVESSNSPDASITSVARRRSRFASQKMEVQRVAASREPQKEDADHAEDEASKIARAKRAKGGRRASTRTSIVLHKLDEKADLIANFQKREDSLAEENTMLREMLASVKSEFVDLQRELIRLEQVEFNVLELTGRAEYAESRFEDISDQMRSMTPRPERNFGAVGVDSDEIDTQDLMDILNDALDEPKYRDMPAESLTSMLLGQTDNGVPLQPYMSFRGCLEPIVSSSANKMSRKKLEDALKCGDIQNLEDVCPHEVILLMQRALRDKFEVVSFCNFLCGIDACSNPIDPDYFGSISHMGVPRHELLSMIKNGSMPTAERVNVLNEDKRKMRREIQDAKDTLNRFMQTEQRKEMARKKREQQQRKMKPIDLFLADLESSDLSKYKSFIGLGNGSDVPSFLRFHGKVPVKKMSKRETEKMTKEIWKAKLEWEAKTGDQFYLIDFVYIYLKDAVGIQSSIAMEGYNFVFSLKKHSYDVDCELFLKILTGEVMEEVYLEQLELQTGIEKLMVTLDRVSNKKETGFVDKTELKSALLSYFCVGQPNGKQTTRFEELLEKLNTEQPLAKVDYKKLLKEDEDFNQGPFMECAREQMLVERIEYFKELENLIYEETGFDEKCDEEQVRSALQNLNPDLSKLELRKKLQSCFPKGVEVTTVALALATLKRGATKISATRGGKKGKRNARASIIG
ncbi:hypothetical protein HOP50_04g30170 [Chloropicon primus]|uniref:EF-hand domain-containing protein n=1 Tax=Chloropicon primus TaxID=1764295 RepID=A0A5B8MJB1_9CHLO|nr:hypothetical protein A3770_04p30170 [Chloropicon primus]UPQ99709.1 hypothetical protein HOP50_04g30170 [Chloropicon primus]|eukprot:QDZ20499.1 hypothetical protein A3770_04p30170 [Chloropicon primus]